MAAIKVVAESAWCQEPAAFVAPSAAEVGDAVETVVFDDVVVSVSVAVLRVNYLLFPI